MHSPAYAKTMRVKQSPPLHIKHVRLFDGTEAREGELFIENGRIVAKKPNHAITLSLNGEVLRPAFVNFHDHLELNHYPRTKPNTHYTNAQAWGQDVNAQLNQEPFLTLRAPSFWQKAVVGGLKNLLSGATSVYQHGTPHPELFHKDFPVRVIQPYGWAHSLYLTPPQVIQKAYQATPPNVPFFIHLAEGTDDLAHAEYRHLKALGVVASNTVLVHGVAMTEADSADAQACGCRLIWCPSTNLFLLGKTAPLTYWNPEAIKIGSDSRLTAEGDLLAEWQAGIKHFPQGAPHIVSGKWSQEWSTSPFQVGNWADFILTQEINFALDRTAFLLIVREGVPLVGTPEYMDKCPFVPVVSATLDGTPRKIHASLARLIERVKLKEEGLSVEPVKKWRFW